MPKVSVYNLDGEKKGTITLIPEIFDVERKDQVIKLVLDAQIANSRIYTAHTKTRGERRGGGIKPWRQKGTGRARVGSRRSPIWRKGGVVFGPRKERSYSKKVNKKVRKKALFMVLTSKIKDRQFVIVEDLKIEKISTKDFLEKISKLPVKGKKGMKKTLLILPNAKEKKLKLSSRNIDGVKPIQANSLNVKDLLDYEFALLPKESIKVIQETYLPNKKQT